MSWFKNAMTDMSTRKGARKLKTAITRKTEDGSVTVTVKGVVVTDADELADKAAELGVSVSGKGGEFGAASGKFAGSLVDEDASEFVANVCDPDSYSEKPKAKRKVKDKADDSGAKEDTKLENATA